MAGNRTRLLATLKLQIKLENADSRSAEDELPAGAAGAEEQAAQPRTPRQIAQDTVDDLIGTHPQYSDSEDLEEAETTGSLSAAEDDGNAPPAPSPPHETEAAPETASNSVAREGGDAPPASSPPHEAEAVATTNAAGETKDASPAPSRPRETEPVSEAAPTNNSTSWSSSSSSYALAHESLWQQAPGGYATVAAQVGAAIRQVTRIDSPLPAAWWERGPNPIPDLPLGAGFLGTAAPAPAATTVAADPDAAQDPVSAQPATPPVTAAAATTPPQAAAAQSASPPAAAPTNPSLVDGDAPAPDSHPQPCTNCQKNGNVAGATREAQGICTGGQPCKRCESRRHKLKRPCEYSANPRPRKRRKK